PGRARQDGVQDPILNPAKPRAAGLPAAAGKGRPLDRPSRRYVWMWRWAGRGGVPAAGSSPMETPTPASYTILPPSQPDTTSSAMLTSERMNSPVVGAAPWRRYALMMKSTTITRLIVM